MNDSRRAALMLQVMAFAAVMVAGWLCGSSPMFTAFVAGIWERLTATATAQPGPPPVITPARLSPAFRPEVTRWENEILAWSAAYTLDPNLVATIMQIESCGDPQAVSPSGAAGLFQVMPFHFAPGDDALDPQTNATRGLGFFADSLQKAGGDTGLALAAYNGGQGLIDRPSFDWPGETRDYYEWGVGIYADVLAGLNPSPTLERWLAAGGASLCAQAAAR